MKKYKYNPFKAASILIAMMMFIRDGANFAKAEFVPDEKHKDKESATAVFEAFQKEAAKDTQHHIYPKHSMFRRNNSFLMAWYAEENEWKEAQSEAVQAAIVCLYGNLTNLAIVNELKTRMVDLGQEQQCMLLETKGDTLIRSKLYELLQDKDIRKKVLSLWTKEPEVKAEESEEETEGAEA